MSECTLKSDGQCCCNCIHHIPTFEHCTTNLTLRVSVEKLTKKPTCICHIQNGWACQAPDSRLYTNWPEHSIGCELYEAKYV